MARVKRTGISTRTARRRCQRLRRNSGQPMGREHDGGVPVVVGFLFDLVDLRHVPCARGIGA
jgi:hypothetical protein